MRDYMLDPPEPSDADLRRFAEDVRCGLPDIEHTLEVLASPDIEHVTWRYREAFAGLLAQYREVEGMRNEYEVEDLADVCEEWRALHRQMEWDIDHDDEAATTYYDAISAACPS